MRGSPVRVRAAAYEKRAISLSRDRAFLLCIVGATQESLLLFARQKIHHAVEEAAFTLRLHRAAHGRGEFLE